MLQDHLYVQYVELDLFQNEFTHLVNKFNENEKELLGLKMSGTSIDDIKTHLDKLDSVMENISVDALRAKRLSKAGQKLIAEHSFTRDFLEPKCFEIKMMCKRQEVLFTERRQALLNFCDLFDSIENVSKWCKTVNQHLKKDQETMERDQDVLSRIQQLDYLLSKSRNLNIKSRLDFEEHFDSIKDLISPKTLFLVDDTLSMFDTVKQEVIHTRETLREKVAKNEEGIPAAACEDSDNLALRYIRFGFIQYMQNLIFHALLPIYSSRFLF